MNIGIYIYDQAEVLDFSGPFEVFSTASRICPDEHPFKVFLIGETGQPVVARAGYQVIPNYGIHTHPQLDLLIVAGGYHHDEIKKGNVLNWIAKQAEQVGLIASVCSGAWLLAEAGVLTNQNVTTHWEDIPALQESFPHLKVYKNSRWIDAREVITSAGISAGIDMSLHLVGRFHSIALAQKTAKQMEYDWVKN